MPLTFGLSLLSAAAAMREDERVRRPMAGAFALLLGLAGAFYAYHPHHGTLSNVVAIIAAIGLLLQLVYALWPEKEEVPPRLPGTADTKPPALWAYWAFQGLSFVAFGLSLLLLPWFSFARVVYMPEALQGATMPPAGVFFQQLRGTYFVGLGLFSFQAMGVERESHWRLYADIFSVIAAVAIAVLALFWTPGTHTPAALLSILPFLAVLLANRTLARKPRDPVAEEIGRGPDGWTLLDLPAGPLLAIQALFYGRRSTHLMGVAARGKLRVVDDDDQYALLKHSFFTKGRELPVQVRFATLTSRDDASYDIRGAALRLSGHVDVPSPFDMLMNSGSFSGPNNMILFTLGVVARFLPQSFFAKNVRTNMELREGLIAGRRRAPECYTTVHYYSQVVRFWVDTDHARRLVRYRLVHADPDRKESGIPDALDEQQIWVRERRKDEHRPSDYLRTELKRKLSGERPIVMKFQAQFRVPQPGDSLDWYNSGADWPEDECPWITVAHLTLEAPLSDEEAELLQFNAANHPPSLGIPVANGMRDYRSLADAERRVIRRLAYYRLQMYRVFGFPKFGNTLPNEPGK